MTEALNKRPVLTDKLLIDAAWVKEKFLFGVNLQDDNGNEMSDALVNFYIRSAQQYVARELDVLLFETEIVEEAHDYMLRDYDSFSFIQLFRRPVQSVSKVILEFPFSSNRIEFHEDWFRVDSISGQLNLLPTMGSLTSVFISGGGAFLPWLSSTRDYLPCTFRVSYKAGFGKDEVPEDFLEVMGMRAAMGPLNIAGDLIAGAGIANKSISLDGLSQSIGTTSSATNAGYGARIIQYHKEIESFLSRLRPYYAGLRMAVA